MTALASVLSGAGMRRCACGALLVPKDRRNVWCSKPCRMRHYWRVGERRHKYRPLKRGVEAAACRHCGAGFTRDVSVRRKRLYCSIPCRRAAGRMRAAMKRAA